MYRAFSTQLWSLFVYSVFNPVYSYNCCCTTNLYIMFDKTCFLATEESQIITISTALLKILTKRYVLLIGI